MIYFGNFNGMLDVSLLIFSLENVCCWGLQSKDEQVHVGQSNVTTFDFVFVGVRGPEHDPVIKNCSPPGS